jgi:hypothetical protein
MKDWWDNKGIWFGFKFISYIAYDILRCYTLELLLYITANIIEQLK